MEIHHRAYVARSAILTVNAFVTLTKEAKHPTFAIEEGNWSDDDAFLKDPILKTIDGELKPKLDFCHWFTIQSARKEASDERKPFVGLTKVAFKAAYCYTTQEARELKYWVGTSVSLPRPESK